MARSSLLRVTAACVALATVVVVLLLAGRGEATDLDTFVVGGIFNGVLFAFLAVGVVMVYRVTGVLNLTQGEFGTVAAYLLFAAVHVVGLPYGVALVLALAAVVVLGVVVERVVIRPLEMSSTVVRSVATVGVAAAAMGAQALIFRAGARSLTPVLPPATQGMTLFGFVVQPQNLVALGVLLVVAGALFYLRWRTRAGLALDALSQDAVAADVLGVDRTWTSRVVWGSSALLGAVAGALYVPLGALTPGVVSATVLAPAVAAALIGGLRSVSGAFLGAFVVGVAQAVAQWAATNYHLGGSAWAAVLPGSEHVVVLLVVLVALLARSRGVLEGTT